MVKVSNNHLKELSMKALKFFLTLNAVILLLATPLILVSEAHAERAPIQGLSRQPSEAAAKV